MVILCGRVFLPELELGVLGLGQEVIGAGDAYHDVLLLEIPVRRYIPRSEMEEMGHEKRGSSLFLHLFLQ